MWRSGALATSMTVQDALDCFMSKQFLEAYHLRCGHVRLEIGPAVAEGNEGAAWRRVTRFAVSMVDGRGSSLMRSLLGGLDVGVEQTTVIELLDAGARLLVRARSAIASGPASQLASCATWELKGWEMRMETEVKFGGTGLAQRLMAGTIEQSAGDKAKELMGLWWQMAQEEAAQNRLRSPISSSQGVQRALSFDEVGSEREDEEEEEDGKWADERLFEDASSMLQSPSVRQKSGLLVVLAAESKDLAGEVEALRERRNRLELEAMEQRPQNPLLRLARWVNRQQAAGAVATPLPRAAASSWGAAMGAVSRLARLAARVRMRVAVASVVPWLLLLVVWLVRARRRRGR